MGARRIDSASDEPMIAETQAAGKGGIVGKPPVKLNWLLIRVNVGSSAGKSRQTLFPGARGGGIIKDEKRR